MSMVIEGDFSASDAKFAIIGGEIQRLCGRGSANGCAGHAQTPWR